jgi:lipopolysaccharide biosynthesis glycosyltransferase
VTKRDEIVVVCGTDAGYVAPLAVMLQSALSNLAADRTLVAYVLCSDVDAEERARVSKGLPDERFSIHWLRVDAARLDGVPLWGRMPVSTYFKLFLTDLLPASVTRALWLDCDVLVTGDLAPLWDQELRGFCAGAVQDQLVPFASSRGGIGRRLEVGIPDDARYFNAGVMLIDVARWRSERIAVKALDHLRRRWKSVVFWDQEGLNVALAGKWIALDSRWNYNVSLPLRRKRAGEDAPVILHFAGMLKPWLYRTKDPEWSQYMTYLDRTAWAGIRPPWSASTLMISIYERSGARVLLHPLENFALELVRRASRTAIPESRIDVAASIPVENR